MHFAPVEHPSVMSPPSPAPSAVLCEALLGLTSIFESQVQIAVLQRAANPSISQYLQALHLQRGACSGLRAFVAPGTAFSLANWQDLPGRRALEADITTLIEMYADLMDCAQVGVRLEVLTKAMCPRFHVDRTGIRLLCTYCGPGTDWLDDRYADRRFLGAGAQGVPDEQSGLIGRADAVHRVPPFAVALLKGESWQGNAGRGLIHRSPPVSANEAPRVLLALDAIW